MLNRSAWDPKQGTHGAVVLHGKVIVVTGINTKEDCKSTISILPTRYANEREMSKLMVCLVDREKAKLVLKRGQHEPLNKKISHFVKDAKAAIY